MPRLGWIRNIARILETREDEEPVSSQFEAEPSSTWWSRPCGVGEVLRVAMPLVLSSLSWTVLTFIDRMFLMWWSEESLAASFPAALLWWTVLCCPLGICSYASTFVSQYYGAGEHRKIGPIVWQSVWLGLIATPLTMLPMLFSESIFAAGGHEAAVRAEETIYFRILGWGSAPMLVSYALSSFFSGQGKTWVVMLVDGWSVLLNIVLDYVWIFGHAGFPAAGIAGGGWATVVAVAAKVPIYLILLARSPNRSTCASWRLGFRWRLFKRLLIFGGPAGLQMLLDIAGFTAFVFLVGRLGGMELTATNLAFNVSSLAFMPVYGLGLAASILVGQQLGRDSPDLAARGTWTTVWLAMSYMTLVSTLYVVVPDLFLFGFFAHEAGQRNGEVRAIAVVLLRYVAAYNLFDALNMVFVGAIKGAGDTRFIFGVSLIMAVLLAAGTWIAVSVFGAGLHGCWTLVTVWIWLLGVIYCVRFLRGRWRGMRVIEREAPLQSAG